VLSSLWWWPALVVATIEGGDVDHADQLVHQLVRAADARGLDLHARIEGLRARVALARGDPEEAASAFDRAIGSLGADDPLLDRALLHHEFGRLLHARGNRREALDQLRLAPQHVVVLVSKGMTNRDVAAQLYVSAKSIEYHLRNVYGKLGITSRRELRAMALN
jgi:ATP/maltotriose-dependent transcriptional regulator MalT